jgi:hypothetical protein
VTVSLPERLEEVLDALFAYSRSRSYRGNDKHDGLNSRLLMALFGFAKWPRILTTQAMMRSPVNLRPLLGVPPVYNPKGLALFSRALLDRYSYTQQAEHLAEAERLLALLLQLRSPGQWAGIAWGYHYPWQDLGFFAPTNTPNAVVTCFVCEAFLSAYRITGKTEYLNTVADAARFFMTDLTVLKDSEEELCLSYMPMSMQMRVMDVSILIGSVQAQLAELTKQNSYLTTSHRLVRYVVNQQTVDGAWYYTDPPAASPVKHDNYHTGFILDALWRYMRACNDYSYQDVYDRGLKFYADFLFESDGAPRWMSDRQYPYDIHGAAQGILTFARHRDSYPGFAEKVAGWALNNMYSDEGRFFYQKTRYFTKKFTFLRWCNGWMAHALAALNKELLANNDR